MTGTSAMMACILRDLPAGNGSSLLGGDPDRCARVLGVDGIAVSVSTDGALTELVWSTPGRSTALDDAQYTLGEGPGLDACRYRSLIALPDLQQADPRRWPAFLPEAERLGARALFSFPLNMGAVCLGVFTAQRATPAPLDTARMNDAFVLTAAITAALIRDNAQRQSFSRADPPTTLHRAAVHQAAGIISVQADVSLTEAMVLLRAYAYRTENPLLETAGEVVARRLHFRNDRDGTIVPSSDKD